MYKIVLTLSLLVLSNLSYPQIRDFSTQSVSGIDDYDKELKTVQVEAKFPGGVDGWTTFLVYTLKSNVPVKHRAPAGLYTVICSFLVSKDGTISEVMALNDPGYGVAEEAVRVLKKSPKWMPAMQQGKPVVYRQKQSITFEVSEAN
ncbi:MAG TPA: energy transducer TonB [Chitinophagaceae bacterium]|jgi:protein TonB